MYKTTASTRVNRPFCSCLLGDLAFVWQRGCRWPCFDTDLSAFVMYMRLVSIRTTWFTQQKQRGLIKTRLPPVSLPYKGQVTEQATVKLSIHAPRTCYTTKLTHSGFSGILIRCTCILAICVSSTNNTKDCKYFSIILPCFALWVGHDNQKILFLVETPTYLIHFSFKSGRERWGLLFSRWMFCNSSWSMQLLQINKFKNLDVTFEGILLHDPACFA